MPGERYCTPSDVMRLGLARGALANPAREVAADVAADAIVWQGHSLELDARLEFVAFPGGSLPGGLTAGTTYRAIPLSESRFQVSLTDGGPPVSLTSSGSKFGVVVSLEAILDDAIAAASQRLHRYLPAAAVPLVADGAGRYPDTARHIVAVWALHSVCVVLGQRNALVAEEVARLDGELKLLLAGIPSRDTGIAVEQSNVARYGSAAPAERRVG